MFHNVAVLTQINASLVIKILISKTKKPYKTQTFLKGSGYDKCS